MKKTDVLFLLVALLGQLVIAEHQETFFQTFKTDIKALIKGDASPEQKERLVKQAAITIMVFSLSLYGVAAWGAMQDRYEVPPIKLGGFLKPGGPRGRRRPSRKHLNRGRSDTKLKGQRKKTVPELASSESMRDLFEQPTPSAHAVLRNDSMTPGRENSSDTPFRKKDIFELPEDLSSHFS